MGKTRKTITIDDELARIVDDRDEFNLSGFVNRCLEQHLANGDIGSPESAALRAELERVERQLAETQSEEQRLREERKRIENELDNTDDEPDLLAQARDKLQGTPRKIDNPAIQTWAGKLGMPPADLVEALDEEAVADD